MIQLIRHSNSNYQLHICISMAQYVDMVYRYRHGFVAIIHAFMYICIYVYVKIDHTVYSSLGKYQYYSHTPTAYVPELLIPGPPFTNMV